MTTVLVTGAAGFIGKNLVEALKRQDGVTVLAYDRGNSDEDLAQSLAEADIIYHLAGVNRPQNVDEYEAGNAGFAGDICARLESIGRTPKIVVSSSIQAELDNPYGISKRHGEDEFRKFSERTAADVVIYRLKNVFGKWCRPNYNSVVATFCYNIANGLPISISDPTRILELVYIDDVVKAFLSELDRGDSARGLADVSPSFSVSLGDLAAKVESFKSSRVNLVLPDYSDDFTRRLYATYLSYLGDKDFAYSLDIKTDNRGSLAEFLKSPPFGQLFVSRTKPGITRGNHYHHTKTEKFFVVEGDAIVRFRHINDESVIEYPVSRAEYRVVDIPPGYTHSIENVGDSELVVLFWSSELFNPEEPDTYFSEVIR